MGTRTLDWFWIVDELIARVGRLPQQLESRGYREAARALQAAERQERALRLGHQAEQLAARAAYEEARELIRDAVALDPDRAGLWLQKGKQKASWKCDVFQHVTTL